MPDTVQLRASASVTLDGTGAGTVQLGPGSSPGPAYWRVTGLVVQTTRPASAPIPRFQAYRNEATADNSIGLNYDGSFAQAIGDEVFTRGEILIGRWTGGQLGDVATLTISGEKW